MGRPKVNPDYDPEKARDELVRVVADFYLTPQSEEMTGKNGKTKMMYMKREFGLSMSKIRKLLVTAGVYEFVKNGMDLVPMIEDLRCRGLNDEQIREELSISVGTLNSLTPYKSGTYNADFTADGYDLSNVSAEARRKRNQRKRQKMKETSVLAEREERIEEMVDRRTFMDRYKEEEKAGLEKDREKSRAWLKQYGFESRVGLYDKVVEAYNQKKIDVTDIPGMEEMEPGSMENPLWEILCYVRNLQDFVIPDDEKKEPDVKTMGSGFLSDRYVHGRRLGDYIFLPSEKERYQTPWGEIVSRENAILTGFIDQNGEKHVFVVTDQINGPMQLMEHREVYRVQKNGERYAGQPDTAYEFTYLGKDGQQSYNIDKLIEKTAIALQNLTMERKVNRGYSEWHHLMDGKYIYMAKQVGTITVLDDSDGKVYFSVDGKKLHEGELEKLFSVYVGSTILYQKADVCDEPIEDDMTLMPMRIDEDTLAMELQDLLFAMTDQHEGKFLKKEDVAAFDVLFKKIIDKLKLYFGNHPREIGKDAGNRLIKVLKGIGTDDNMFPEYEIKMVKDAVTDVWEEILPGSVGD